MARRRSSSKRRSSSRSSVPQVLLAIALLVSFPCSTVVGLVPGGEVTVTSLIVLGSALLVAMTYTAIFAIRRKRTEIWTDSLKALKLSQNNVELTSSEGRQLLKTFDWRDLEIHTSEVFAAAGYKTRVTRKANDGGVDVLLRNPKGEI